MHSLSFESFVEYPTIAVVSAAAKVAQDEMRWKAVAAFTPIATRKSRLAF